MGIKGTVRRNQDGNFIHANIDLDVIITEEVGELQLEQWLSPLVIGYIRGTLTNEDQEVDTHTLEQWGRVIRQLENVTYHNLTLLWQLYMTLKITYVCFIPIIAITSYNQVSLAGCGRAHV